MSQVRIDRGVINFNQCLFTEIFFQSCQSPRPRGNLEQMCSMCVFQISLLSIITPKYFTLSVRFSYVIVIDLKFKFAFFGL